MAKRSIAKVQRVDKQERAPERRTFDELGSSGLQRTGFTRGWVDEELLHELRGERGRKIYREMRDNDAVINSMFFAIEMLIRQAQWRVEGEDQEAVEFVTSCMEDCSHTWEDFVAEVLSMLTFGFAWQEIVYKRRNGPAAGEKVGSRFTDGKIGWRKLPGRAQETLMDWQFDEEGGVQAFIQSAPPDFKEVSIPISRSLLFRTSTAKNNPEGRSLLRGAYRSWYFKRHIENIEGIGIERDLAGLPVIYRTKRIADQYDAELQKIIKRVRRDEQEGLILPLVIDPDTKQKELEFSLLSSAGNRQIDVGKVLERYSRAIAMTVMADFLFLGQGESGSWALSSNKTALFANAIATILNSIQAVVNRYAIPRLLAVNSMQVEELPQVQHGDIETPDLKELGAYVTALAGAGASLFPDDDLEKYLRQAAHLPEKSEEAKTQPSGSKAPPPKKPAAPAATEVPEEEDIT